MFTIGQIELLEESLSDAQERITQLEGETSKVSRVGCYWPCTVSTSWNICLAELISYPSWVDFSGWTFLVSCWVTRLLEIPFFSDDLKAEKSKYSLLETSTSTLRGGFVIVCTYTCIYIMVMCVYTYLVGLCTCTVCIHESRLFLAQELCTQNDSLCLWHNNLILSMQLASGPMLSMICVLCSVLAPVSAIELIWYHDTKNLVYMWMCIVTMCMYMYSNVNVHMTLYYTLDFIYLTCMIQWL